MIEWLLASSAEIRSVRTSCLSASNVPFSGTCSKQGSISASAHLQSSSVLIGRTPISTPSLYRLDFSDAASSARLAAALAFVRERALPSHVGAQCEHIGSDCQPEDRTVTIHPMHPSRTRAIPSTESGCRCLGAGVDRRRRQRRRSIGGSIRTGAFGRVWNRRTGWVTLSPRTWLR